MHNAIWRRALIELELHLLASGHSRVSGRMRESYACTSAVAMS